MPSTLPENPSPRPPEASAALAAGGSPRLDIHTSYDRGRYLIRVTRYPSGLVEVIATPRRDSPDSGQKPTPRVSGNPRREDSLHRTKANIRRRLMALDAQYLLTLTTRANTTDYSLSREQVSKFLRKLRRAYPGLHYCGTPEQQKRGAWHWHLGVNQRICARTARTLWRDVVTDGNIDLQHRNALHVARYVSKYIGKDVNGTLPGAAYVVSRGIPDPITEEYTSDEPYEALSVLAEANPDWSGSILHLPEHRGYWAASWR